MEKSNTAITFNSYAKGLLENRYRYDNPIQRGFVWDKQKMSKLVETFILNDICPPIYVVAETDENGKRYYDIIDGQQRSVTILKMINDEFEITGLDDIVIDEEKYDINGLKYSQFPEKLKEKINNFDIIICYCNDVTQEQKARMYNILNNGKPLSTKDRNIANCSDLSTAIEIGKNPFFSLVLTQSGLQQKKQIALVMKIWAMLNLDIHEISFDSKSFNTLLRHTMISDQERTEIETVMNYMSSLLEIAFKNKGLTPEMKNAGIKLKKEIHYISLVPIAKKALDNEIPVEKFYEFCLGFFGKSEDEMDIAYKAACTAQTARNSSILARHEVLEEEFNNFLEFCKDTAE